MGDVALHGYWRSSASYRVRIALNLKGVDHRTIAHHLGRGGQHDPAFRRLNPQGLVPVLEVDGAVLTQSLAICEYLDERHPDPPLLPGTPAGRAAIRAAALAVACDIHPLQTLRVLQRLKAAGVDPHAWARSVIEDGLDAFARTIAGTAGRYCFGDAVTLADVMLVPQLANAHRFGAAVPARLAAIEQACLSLEAFRRAAPERQPDAEPPAG